MVKKLRALFYRILDRYCPIVCLGKYRLHHFHWKEYRTTEVTIKSSGTFSDGCFMDRGMRRQRNDFYVCCRCGYERMYAGDRGPMVREDGNEIRRVG